MQQKVVQIGNSIGVILPQVLAKNTLKAGDIVEVDKDQASGTFMISKNKRGAVSSLTPHFMEVIERVNKQYGAALKELAGK